jgi:large subunit ribosomal protein L18
MRTQIRQAKKKIRHRRVRKRVIGSEERPRLHVQRSGMNMYAQVIDDFQEKTIASSSTLTAELRQKKKKQWGNVESAKEFGSFVALVLKKKNIEKIVFDRGGLPFQGRVRAFAEALRDSGVKF